MPYKGIGGLYDNGSNYANNLSQYRIPKFRTRYTSTLFQRNREHNQMATAKSTPAPRNLRSEQGKVPNVRPPFTFQYQMLQFMQMQKC